MPVKVVKRGDRYRVVESSGRLAKNISGNPVDGGGHETKKKADSQARAINASPLPRKMGKRN